MISIDSLLNQRKIKYREYSDTVKIFNEFHEYVEKFTKDAKNKPNSKSNWKIKVIYIIGQTASISIHILIGSPITLTVLAITTLAGMIFFSYTTVKQFQEITMIQRKIAQLKRYQERIQELKTSQNGLYKDLETIKEKIFEIRHEIHDIYHEFLLKFKKEFKKQGKPLSKDSKAFLSELYKNCEEYVGAFANFNYSETENTELERLLEKFKEIQSLIDDIFSTHKERECDDSL